MNQAVNALKAQLAALTPSEFTALQAATVYHDIQLKCRSTGKINAFLGALTLWFGLNNLDLGVIGMVQTGLGALFIGLSLWAVLRPSLDVISVFRWLFLAAALYNGLLVLVLFGGTSWLLVGLAVLQFKWAIDYQKLYQRHRANPPQPPTDQTERLLDAIFTTLPKLKITQDENIIEFELDWRKWRAWLIADSVFLYSSNWGKVFSFIGKPELTLTPRKPVSAKMRRIPIHGRLSALSTYGSISRLAYERYHLWKPGAETDRETASQPRWSRWAASLPFSSLPLLLQIPLLVIGIGALCYILFIIATLIQYRHLI